MKVAQIDFNSLENEAAPNFSGNSVGSVVSQAVGDYLFPFLGFVLLIFLVYGGYQIMTSGNVPQKMQEGQKTITYAIVGFIIMFLAYWIVKYIGQALDIEVINQVFQ